MNNPYSVQISLVEGCNRRCAFCGICSIRQRPMEDIRFMDLATIKAIANQLREFDNNPRLELAMHGEPTLHPFFNEYVRLLRSSNPGSQISLTTNGYGIFSGKNGNPAQAVYGYFRSGIDFIVLDTYEPEREATIEKARAISKSIGATILDFYQTDVSPWHNHRRKLKNAIFLMDDIGVRSGEKKSRTLFNHAGNSLMIPREAEPKKATCTIPFREMSVCYNGDVCACCMDWKHELVAGSVTKNTMRQIWTGPVFTAIRRSLSQKNRSFNPCRWCSCGSGTRSGLLEKQDPMTEMDRAILQNGGMR